MKKTIRLISLLLCLLMCAGGCALAEEANEEWYRERADLLVSELHELSGCEEYVSYFSGSAEILSQVSAWHEALSAEPVRAKRYLMPSESLIPLVLNIADVELPEAAYKRIGRGLGGVLISMSANTQGVTFLAAASVLNLSEGYIMPEGFEPCIIVYEYDGVCVGVTFTQIGEDVVSASAQICTPDVTMFLAPASTEGAASASSPLLPGANESDAAERTRPAVGGAKRGR